MKRTTLTLPDELAYVLKREARRRDTSVSEVARGALNEHFGLTGDARSKERFPVLGPSGRSDTAERAEEILEEEIVPAIEEDAFGGRGR